MWDDYSCIYVNTLCLSSAHSLLSRCSSCESSTISSVHVTNTNKSFFLCQGSGSICLPSSMRFIPVLSFITSDVTAVESTLYHLIYPLSTVPPVSSPLFFSAYPKKDRRGPKVGFWRGVEGCVCMSQRGIYSPPELGEVYGVGVWPSVDATVSSCPCVVFLFFFLFFFLLTGTKHGFPQTLR